MTAAADSMNRTGGRCALAITGAALPKTLRADLRSAHGLQSIWRPDMWKTSGQSGQKKQKRRVPISFVCLAIGQGVRVLHRPKTAGLCTEFLDADSGPEYLNKAQRFLRISVGRIRKLGETFLNARASRLPAADRNQAPALRNHKRFDINV
jgi:hypothetical protein